MIAIGKTKPGMSDWNESSSQIFRLTFQPVAWAQGD